MPFRENAPDKRVHFLRLLRRRGTSSANGPDRFVSNDDTGEIGGCQPAQTAVNLRFYDIERLSLITLLQSFADADDRDQSSFERSLGFLTNHLIVFEVILPSLRMPNNNVRTPCILNHERGHFTSERALSFLGRAVLRRDLDV